MALQLRFLHLFLCSGESFVEFAMITFGLVAVIPDVFFSVITLSLHKALKLVRHNFEQLHKSNLNIQEA